MNDSDITKDSEVGDESSRRSGNTRRHGRELALQLLFQIDMMGDDSSEAIAKFCENFGVATAEEPFMLKLVSGVREHVEGIDQWLVLSSSNWKLTRMSRVDRNVIRIATYELLYCDDIPAKVSINEAVDIGKRYGTEDSGAFINGILDNIRLRLEEQNLLANKRE